MAENTQSALLAVDGGGTKTEFVLISPEGNLLRRFVLEGANPNNASIEQSFQVLCRGIDQALQNSVRLLGIYIGCAGMVSGNNGPAMTALLKKQYPGIPLRCESDICNILACAQDPDNAIAAICGTGSVVYATAQGKLLRAGGSGWMLDPCGSGYELGRQALVAALEDRDGTGAHTLLTAMVEQQLGGTVWEHIPNIYSMPPAGIAAFAPLVLTAWQQNDAVAEAIVERNCSRIAQLICHAAAESPKATQVMLGGSILKESLPFRQRLIQMLPNTLQINTFSYPPIWGACLQCIKLCGFPNPDETIFLSQYETEVTQC